MDFEAFRQTLKLSAAEAETVYPGFAESAATLPAAGLEVLSPEYLKTVFPHIGFDAEEEEKLLAFAGRLDADRAWRLMFHHAFRTLFVGENPQALKNFPEFRAAFGSDAGVFYLLLGCAVFSPARESYLRAGLPLENLRLVGRKIRTTDELNRLAFGDPGYYRHAIYWLRNYVDLSVVPVGRFEFRHSSAAKYNLVVLRRRADGRIVALTGRTTLGFLPDGDIAPVTDPRCIAAGALIDEPEFVIGAALDPASGKRLGTVKLSKSEWEYAIAPTDPILEWHIPGGGGMTPEITRASLEAGFEFFDRYFPELPRAKAIMCSSWIFWQRYEELRPQANPALAMRECSAFARPGRSWSGFYFLFGANKPEELPAPPRGETSLQRTVLKLLAENGPASLGNGGVFILREHLDRWGTSPYRNALRVDDIARYLI